MTILTETRHAAEFIMSEGNGKVSRAAITIASGEGVIAAPLEAIARAHPDMSLGSYPFYGADGFGSNLVLRSRDAASVPSYAHRTQRAPPGPGGGAKGTFDAERPAFGAGAGRRHRPPSPQVAARLI